MNCGCGMTRRGFLTGLLAAGTAAVLPGCATTAPAVAKRGLIDVHHHYFEKNSTFGWTVEQTLADMDSVGTRMAMLSVARPEPATNPEQARRLARAGNEYAARLGIDHKGRFGSFASPPLLNMDDALKEIEYAMDVLKANGIALRTSLGDKWLGNPYFAPMMAELNRRKAVVFVHPTTAECCNNLVKDIPATVIEYGTDTTRTITNIVFSGTAARYPDIRFIFSHAGGTLPFLTERLLKLPEMNPALKASVPNGVLHELRRFHYDTAWSATPYALSSLMKLVDPAQVVFGTDFPYRTSLDTVNGLVDYGYAQKDLDAITQGNASRLLGL